MLKSLLHLQRVEFAAAESEYQLSEAAFTDLANKIEETKQKIVQESIELPGIRSEIEKRRNEVDTWENWWTMVVMWNLLLASCIYGENASTASGRIAT